MPQTWNIGRPIEPWAGLSEETCVQYHVCPVCRDGLVRGVVNQRKGLQEHLKRSRDPSHREWVKAVYKMHFTKRRKNETR